MTFYNGINFYKPPQKYIFTDFSPSGQPPAAQSENKARNRRVTFDVPSPYTYTNQRGNAVYSSADQQSDANRNNNGSNAKVSADSVNNAQSTHNNKKMKLSESMLIAENAQPGVRFYSSQAAKKLISKIHEVRAAPSTSDKGRVEIVYTLENVPFRKLTAYIGSQAFHDRLGIDSVWVIVPE